MMKVGDRGYLYSYNVYTGELACNGLKVRRTEGEIVTGIRFNECYDFINYPEGLTVRFKPGTIEHTYISKTCSLLLILSPEKNDCDVALIFAENEEKVGRGENAAKLRDMARRGENWVFYKTALGTEHV